MAADATPADTPVVSSTGERAAARPEDRVPTPAELAAAAPPWGDRAVRLRVGALEVELTGLDSRLAALVRRHYARFVRDGAPGEHVLDAGHVAVARAPVAHYLFLPRGRGRAEEARVGARATAAGVEVWSYFFAGTYRRDEPGGRLLLCEADELDASQAVENMLRFYLSCAALRSGGFLLHSAGVIRDGRAWLFFGPSGAGKSTTASNAGPGATLLGDDLVLVEPGPDGRFRACGVPFRGSFQGLAPNSPACAPLAAACRLFQDREPRVTRAALTVQVAELLGEVPFLLDDDVLRARALEAVLRFARAVPVRRLHLPPDGSFWRALAGI